MFFFLAHMRTERQRSRSVGADCCQMGSGVELVFGLACYDLSKIIFFICMKLFFVSSLAINAPFSASAQTPVIKVPQMTLWPPRMSLTACPKNYRFKLSDV